MRDYRIVDVFTDRAYAGNPLAVVLDAAGLSEAQMQAMAGEFNLSETIFVLPAPDAGSDAAVRIFLPRSEIPFAGHPVIGCASVLADVRWPADRTEGTVTLVAPAGRVVLSLTRAGGVAQAEFTAPRLPERTGDAPPAAVIAAGLGIAAEAIGLPGLAPGVWAAGPDFLVVPVADRATVARAAPQAAAFAALTQAAGTRKVYLVTPGEATDWRVRMFAPGEGVAEDPATGSAAVVLAGPLMAAGRLSDGETRLTIAQGAEMGRPARLSLRTRVADGRLTSVHVGGAAVPVAMGRIAPP